MKMDSIDLVHRDNYSYKSWPIKLFGFEKAEQNMMLQMIFVKHGPLFSMVQQIFLVGTNLLFWNIPVNFENEQSTVFA